MKVYATQKRIAHHFDPKCYKLTNSAKLPIQEFDTSEITWPHHFCKTCSPAGLPALERDVPHRRCLICRPDSLSTRPCAHNGGVYVERVVAGHSRAGNNGDYARTHTRHYWRWLEIGSVAQLVRAHP